MKKSLETIQNPIIPLDYPDPDVIRVEDTYYMVTTTMHFMPGCEILRSYDLLHWEHAAFVYERLDSTAGQRLAEGKTVMAKECGRPVYDIMKDVLCLFVANDTGLTYCYTAEKLRDLGIRKSLKVSIMIVLCCLKRNVFYRLWKQ